MLDHADCIREKFISSQTYESRFIIRRSRNGTSRLGFRSKFPPPFASEIFAVPTIEEFRRILGFLGTRKTRIVPDSRIPVSGAQELHRIWQHRSGFRSGIHPVGGPPKQGFSQKTPKTQFLGARPGI
jgi:hypothetical protein